MFSYDKFYSSQKHKLQEVTFPTMHRSEANLDKLKMATISLSVEDEEGKVFRLYMSVEEAKMLAKQLLSLAHSQYYENN